jgi:hypothetical protein
VKSPSPVKSIVIELYRKDYSISNCNCEIVNCVSVRVNVE